MANSGEEFFTRLRTLASSVHKESNELRETLENSENSVYNENRACLLLRETLAEVKDLKKEINTKVEEVKQNPPFGDFVSACERLLTQMKQQTGDLETHLEKYGYAKPAEDLPELKIPTKHDKCHPEETSVAMEDTGTTCPLASSEPSENGDLEHDTPMEEDHTIQSREKENQEDLMKSPVPPTTFTRMIVEITPQQPFGTRGVGLLQGREQQTPCGTPDPPLTTTPMIKTKPVPTSLDTPTSNVSTPQDTHFPSKPVTVTPMIKPGNRTAALSECSSPQLASTGLPAPPTMGTPGLKTLASTGLGASSPGLHISLDNLPPPPEITSVMLLKPDDITGSSAVTTGYNLQSQHVFVQPLQEEEYKILPVYVANQFSLECINHHVHTINTFLMSNNEDTTEPSVEEQDLRNLLGLGPATKAFMLALVKTGRLKLSGKSIIFLNSS